MLTSISGTVRFMKSLKFKSKRAGAFGCCGWNSEGVAVLKGELVEAGFQTMDEGIRSMWRRGKGGLASVEQPAGALLE